MSANDRAHHVSFRQRRSTPIAKVLGNTQGLKPSHVKALTRLYQRRFPSVGGYSHEQARELAALSRSVGRQVAVLIDRQGRVAMVLVGDTGAITIPELPRARTGSGRLRGLRLLHTHLGPDLLSQEDLMDLLFLRLDGFGVLTVNEWGEPLTYQHAHLLPQPEDGKPYRVHPAQPWDRVDTDVVAQVEALEAEMARAASDARAVAPARARGTAATAAGAVPQGRSHAEHIAHTAALAAEAEGPAAVLVSVSTAPRPLQELNLAELTELARTAGVRCAGTLIQRVPSLNPKFILGKGKLAELEVLALQGNATMIIFDGELSPAQLRNLADLTERKVLDRTQLILDIFAQHATTRAGKLQVEMAQLKYTQPRLVGKNRAMDRLMGGIGGRGPGETKLETDRRRIRDRIGRIKDELESLRRQRAYARARRAKQRVPLASLVGYTNAGKSTLLNALTNSTVLAENKLFATLDPTTRRLRFPHERELILADTVGFIRNLPKELLEAFRATLEELEAADLLIHVADAGHPELDRQLGAVDTILTDMELHEVPRLLVLNKWDTLDEETREALRAVHPDAITLSAATRQGLDELVASIAARIDWERDLRPCGKRAGKGGEGDGSECPAVDGDDGDAGGYPDEASTDDADAGYDWPEMESDRLN
ncbi:GTPase HflX [Nitratidesulfovibrio liaohensis]|uniref:GTPase HflX n=1 Tax=Nitratidesulfovibrio liaohensis TaxID=2604158 RepID=A0ABY9QXC9_9BACT|nr:GTPase HflX [Nitratidesulfovibrio liaohensis]WMW64196.1 GTPase HflX [Nitratidesulfovibrio liaohensis]